MTSTNGGGRRLAMIGLDAAELRFIREHEAALPVLSRLLTRAQAPAKPLESSAARLAGSKLRRGDRVAVIAETNADFLIFFFGCQYAGLVPVPLPLSINFGGRDAYEARLRGMLMAAGARAAVASEELIEALKAAASRTAVALVGTPAEFYALPAREGELLPLQAHEACYIQYSSGSTSFPRAEVTESCPMRSQTPSSVCCKPSAHDAIHT